MVPERELGVVEDGLVEDRGLLGGLVSCLELGGAVIFEGPPVLLRVGRGSAVAAWLVEIVALCAALCWWDEPVWLPVHDPVANP